MAEWKNEDDIKAELRVLTGELKQLREELRSMVAGPKPNPARALLHRQAWPPVGARTPEAIGSASDDPKRPGKRRADKGR